MRKTTLVTVLIALLAWGATATAGAPSRSSTRGNPDIQFTSEGARRYEVQDRSSGAVKNLYVRRPQPSLGSKVVERLGQRQVEPTIMNARVYDGLPKQARKAAVGVTDSGNPAFTGSGTPARAEPSTLSVSADGIVTIHYRGGDYKLVLELPEASTGTSAMHAQRVRKAMEKVPAVMAREYGLPSRIEMKNDRYHMLVGGHWVPLEADGLTSPSPRPGAVRVAARGAGRVRYAAVLTR